MKKKLIAANVARKKALVGMEEMLDKAGDDDFSPSEQDRFDKLKLQIADADATIAEINAQELRRETMTAAPHINSDTHQESMDRSGGLSFTPQLEAGVRALETSEGQVIYAIPPKCSFAKYTTGPTNLSVGKTILGLVTNNWKNAAAERATVLADMSTGNNQLGGHIVPEIITSRFIDYSRAKSVMFDGGAQTLNLPTHDVTIARVSSDPSIEVKAENDEFSGTNVPLEGKRFVSRLIGAMVKMSRELAEDSPNAFSLVESVLAAAIAEEIDRQALVGDGNEGEMLGVLNYPNVLENAVDGSVDYDELLDGLKLIEDANGIARSYVLDPTSKNSLAKLRSGDGTNSAALYIQPPADISALQKLWTSAMPSTDIIIGDLSTAVIGFRNQLRVESTVTGGDSFGKHQLWIKCYIRCDMILEQETHLCKLTGIS